MLLKPPIANPLPWSVGKDDGGIALFDAGGIPVLFDKQTADYIAAAANAFSEVVPEIVSTGADK